MNVVAFIEYLVAAVAVHAGIVNGFWLTTGRPNITFHPLSKIGLALTVMAAILLYFPTRDALFTIQLCIATLLLFGDIVLVWRAATQP